VHPSCPTLADKAGVRLLLMSSASLSIVRYCCLMLLCNVDAPLLCHFIVQRCCASCFCGFCDYLRYDYTISVDDAIMCCRSQHTNHCCVWLDNASSEMLAMMVANTIWHVPIPFGMLVNIHKECHVIFYMKVCFSTISFRTLKHSKTFGSLCCKSRKNEY